jgi:uncharacterized membrane protein YobD (UPF0266 family)
MLWKNTVSPTLLNHLTFFIIYDNFIMNTKKGKYLIKMIIACNF